MEQEKSIKFKVKRISKINLSKEVRANNPYQGYETYYVILSESNEIYQYCVGNAQSRMISQANESLSLLQSGDEISIGYITKKINSTDTKEVNRIVKIVEIIFQ